LLLQPHNVYAAVCASRIQVLLSSSVRPSLSSLPLLLLLLLLLKNLLKPSKIVSIISAFSKRVEDFCARLRVVLLGLDFGVLHARAAEEDGGDCLLGD